jgi:hypothetical protein
MGMETELHALEEELKRVQGIRKSCEDLAKFTQQNAESDGLVTRSAENPFVKEDNKGCCIVS